MKVSAVKYLSVFRTSFMNFTEYKLEFFMRLFSPVLILIMLYLFWGIVFKASGSETLGGLGFETFYLYIGLATIFSNFSMPMHALELSDVIKHGELNQVLTRPVSLITYYFFRKIPLSCLIATLWLAVFLFVCKTFGFYVPSLLTLVLFLISATLSLLISYAIHIFIGITAFWTYEIYGLLWGLENIISVLSGAYIPLTLFPAPIQQIMNWLPFKHLAFTPAFLYLGKYSPSESLIQLSIQLVWCVILFGAARWLFNRGVKRFDSQGG